MNTRLEHNALPSLDELKLFQEGKLSPERTREIQEMAQENPLLSESLDGYAEAGDYYNLPSFANTRLPGLGADAGAGLSEAAGMTPSSSIGKFGWSSIVQMKATTKIVIGIVLATTVFVFIYLNQEASKAQLAQQTIENNSNSNAHQPNGDDNGMAPTVSSDTTSQTKNDAWRDADPLDNNTDPSGNGEDLSIANRNGAPDQLEPIDRGAPKGGLTERQPDLQPNKSTLIGVGMSEILNYRVADYSDFRKPLWSNEIFGEGHTPANLESKEKQPKEEIVKTLSYMAYLEECIRYYDHRQYQQAKEGFDLLLKLYPEDVNAQFYGAMARFQMGNFSEAIQLFLLTEGNAMRPFKEESKFYRALSMKRSNRGDEAKVLLQEIANAGGFYAKKAKEELK